MSNIYIQEPPTFGKVLLVTTVGDIDIELWSKEAPKACRNFVQLGMEGYYNGTIFHRIVKGFIAQGGDPTGTGTGGDSIYGEPFKNEPHSRLRFVRRGLVATANSENDDNNSQFFFTFSECPELQNKHTIFGKVVGDTIYNMLKLEEVETDENEMPLYPHKIIRMEILNNPFPDIVPRCLPSKKEKEKKKDAGKVKTGVKNFKLLSFGEEAEEDEEENKEVNLTLVGKGKSTHDVLNDPRLSSVPALEKNSGVLGGDKDSNEDPSGKDKLNVEDVRKKLSSSKKTKFPEKRKLREGEEYAEREEYDFTQKETEKKKQRLEEIAKEIQALKKDYHKNRRQEEKKKEEGVKTPDAKSEDNEVLREYKQNLEKYRNLKSNLPKKGSIRESMTLQLLEGFKKKLQAVKDKSEEDEEEEVVKSAKEDNDSESWLAHKLNFEGNAPVLAKDANLKNDEWFDITDPRNPINKRRREQSKTSRRRH